MNGGPEKVIAPPTLVSRFKDIGENPAINPIEEEFVAVFDNAEYRQHSFEEAKRSFEFIFDKEKFINHLGQEPNKESLSYLKQVRRYGLILKAAYRFSDVSHLCGEGLSQFLVLLGQNNDLYWVAPSPEIREEILSKLDDIDFSVNYISTPEFKDYVQKLLSDIEVLLREKELLGPNFHTLRKRIRLFSGLFQVAAAENYGGNLHWLFYSILKISKELGDQHDDLVQQGLQGQIDYNNYRVTLDPNIKERFQKLEPFIKKVCGLTK